MGNIFISYRREDTSGWARSLYDKLEARFGAESLFMDIDNRVLQPGDNFVRVIDESVGQCDILLALIGRRWASVERNGLRRLLEPTDFVRLEISSALQRGIRVVPVLFDQATMPERADLPDDLGSLPTLQAAQVYDSRFHNDVDRLIDALDRLLRRETRLLEYEDSQTIMEAEDPDEGVASGGEAPGPPQPDAPRPLNMWEAIAREHFSIRGLPVDGTLLDHIASRGEESSPPQRLMDRLHRSHRTALCLSGGGLRSVAFGLGVMQGLARRSRRSEPGAGAGELLFKLDYLSTVSGGSYLGGWFTRWAAHPGSAAAVFEELGRGGGTEPEPVRRLRRFSSYFGYMPLGNVPIVIRNVLLNGLTVLPILATLAMLPALLISAAASASWYQAAQNWLLYGGLAVGAAGIIYFVIDFSAAGEPIPPDRHFATYFVLPLIVCAFLLACWYLAMSAAGERPPPVVGKQLAARVAIAFAVALLGGILWTRLRPKIRSARQAQHLLLDGALAIVALGFASILVRPVARETLLPTLATTPAIVLGLELLGFTLLSGAFSRSQRPAEVAWWKRACSALTVAALGWLAVSCAFVFGGRWSLLLKGALFAGGGVVSILLAVTVSGRRAERRLLPAITTGAIAALAGLLLLISDFDRWLLDRLAPHPSAGLPYWPPAIVALAGAMLATLGILMWSRVDVNMFSIQAWLTDHVTRIFAGAGALHDKLNPFTEHDPATDMPLSDIEYRRPLHLFNCAANVTERNEIAGQKSTRWLPFTISRLHCGSMRLGYRPTPAYLGESGPTLGLAIGVSGVIGNPAFFSPAGPVAGLMTLLNRRFGVWVPNPGEPGRSAWRRTGPGFIRALVNELGGLNTADSRWLHLTDGGYFDNLGLFEVVLRRCRTVIVVDATADPGLTSGHLGEAIRKIGMELNIQIDFLSPLPTGTEASVRHGAIARILYGGADPGSPDGWLIYLKPTLNGNEPPDIRQYALENPEFPHGPRPEKFDEAEFETYRRLGLHIIDEICGSSCATYRFTEFVRQVRRYCR